MRFECGYEDQDGASEEVYVGDASGGSESMQDDRTSTGCAGDAETHSEGYIYIIYIYIFIRIISEPCVEREREREFVRARAVGLTWMTVNETKNYTAGSAIAGS